MGRIIRAQRRTPSHTPTTTRPMPSFVSSISSNAMATSGVSSKKSSTTLAGKDQTLTIHYFPHISSSAPLARVVFRDPYRYKFPEEIFIATEGMHTDSFVYYRKKATVTIGNVLPVSQCPDGTIVCNVEEKVGDRNVEEKVGDRNVEEKVGDRGALARMSGNYTTIIGHSPEANKTRILLPSGAKETVWGCTGAP
ncbi:hypothetical protein F4604DRAFT_840341 [Suillus subluteus]|nr:hypothetical protein F4604DRAFT_840341 [Suillus subluteus]